MNDLVSVVIPTHNRAHLIGRAIASVSGQTYGDLQILVVDDCSSDATGSVVASCGDPRVEYYRHATNLGGSAARNTGIRQARGEFVAFLDDDDEWLPDKIEKQLAVLAGNPAFGMVYCGRHYIDDGTGRVLKSVEATAHGTLYRALLRANCIGTTSAALIRRECLDLVGGFDETLPGCQDWDLWIRIAKHYPIGSVPEPLVRFHIHDIRMTSNLEAKIRAKRMLLEKIRSELADDRPALSQHHLVLGKIHCQVGDFEEGRRELVHAMKLCPWSPSVYKYFIPALLGERFYRFAAKLGAGTR